MSKSKSSFSLWDVNILTKLGILILVIGFLAWLYVLQQDGDFFPIQKVEIRGEYTNVDKQSVQETLEPLVNKNFFSIDVKAIQNQLLSYPWISKVYVKRIWPDKLIITFKIQRPKAIWNKNGVFNEKGDLFFPEKEQIPHGLTVLNGVKGQHKQVFNDYIRMKKELNKVGMHIKNLTVTPSHDYTVVLSNNMVIKLGKEHIWQRLERFIRVYDRVFKNSSQEAQSVDMRYTSGMAIKWY